MDPYREMKIMTASPPELTLMLFDGCVGFMRKAIEAIKANKVAVAHANLLRAQEIVVELRVSLDMERGGELAKSLSAVYDYIYRLLVEANVKKDAGLAEEALSLFKPLRDSWAELVEKLRKEGKLRNAVAEVPEVENSNLAGNKRKIDLRG